ncbi:hypothetical protein K504DRAFT_408621, partial [Pleomassaria siparia CBS 279.74]
MAVARSKFELIFDKANIKYEQKTGQRLDITLLSSLTTISDVQRYVCHENERFTAFRKTNQRVYDSLDKALAPLERLSNIAGAASSVGFPATGACFGAAALMIKSAQDVAAHYDRIFDLFETLALILGRFKVKDLERMSAPLNDNFETILALVLEMIAHVTKSINRKRWKEYCARLFMGEDRKLKALEDQLDRQVENGTRLAIDDIENSHVKEDTLAIIDILQKQQGKERDDKLHAILKPTQAAMNQFFNIQGSRVPGTGDWLLREPSFQAWLRKDEPLLWMAGNPGSGKTTYFGSNGHPLYLVFDGIDETEEMGDYGRDGFLRLLPDLRANKTREDFAKVVDQGIERLELDDLHDDLKRRVRDTINDKFEGMFLWAKLLLDIFKYQRNEDQLLKCLNEPPPGIETMITEVLKMYSAVLKAGEPEELNLVLAWLACAPRPLTLSEVDAVLMRMSGSGKRVFSLENRLRQEYASLVVLIRDDGVSTAELQPQNTKASTTKVSFAHTSIAEYFQTGKGKFSQGPGFPAIGVATSEAQFTVLLTCLELLVPFLSDESILRLWCKRIPWKFISSKSAEVIATWANVAGTQDSEISWPSSIGEWARSTMSKPLDVFLPIASVHAQEGLLGLQWEPKQAFHVIAQVRALMLGEQTLDQLPKPLPLDTIIEAVEWPGLKRTATWYRKFAIGLREMDYYDKATNRMIAVYLDEAAKNFEIALVMDKNMSSARGGLAILYAEKKEWAKANDLRLQVVRELVQQSREIGQDNPKSREVISSCYVFIARNYGHLGDSEQALQYWRKAFDTGETDVRDILDYIFDLKEVFGESNTVEVIETLKKFESWTGTPGPNGSNYLTSCLIAAPWPHVMLPKYKFFRLIAFAAYHTGEIPWLEQAYRTAITATKSHLSAIALKISLISLYNVFENQPKKAIPLIEEIAHIS